MAGSHRWPCSSPHVRPPPSPPLPTLKGRDSQSQTSARSRASGALPALQASAQSCRRRGLQGQDVTAPINARMQLCQALISVVGTREHTDQRACACVPVSKAPGANQCSLLLYPYSNV